MAFALSTALESRVAILLHDYVGWQEEVQQCMQVHEHCMMRERALQIIIGTFVT